MHKEKQKTLVMGLGETGFSVARYLSKHRRPFMMADSRRTPPRLKLFRTTFPDTELFLGDYDASLPTRCHEIIVSPGVPLDTPVLRDAMQRGIPVYGDVELFARSLPADKKVLAITGTNGKSTVTTLVARMAERAGRLVSAGGNLGPPALDLLDRRETEWYVLELSSFQLETVASLRPTVATILNLSADHLDRYDSFEQYAQAKRRVYHGSRAVVVNREDKASADALPEAASVVTYGLDAGEGHDFGLVKVNGRVCIAQAGRPWITEDELKGLSGKIGLLNAQAALAIGQMAGLPRSAMLEALRSFEGLPHRMQSLGCRHRVLWINDSKATNVGAAVAALESLDRPCLWIAGGEGKRADFSALRQIAHKHVRTAFFIGRAARSLFEATASAIVAEVVDTMDRAVRRAAELSRPGDCVLLSPACSSLDAYPNYQSRGEHFIKLFSELKT